MEKEWKIGEIKQVNGEWCQCIEHEGCEGCVFYHSIPRYCSYKDSIKFGMCSFWGREDKKSVIFKKLEKVGEPVIILGKVVQLIKTEYQSCISCAFFNGENCGFTTHPRKCGRGAIGVYVEIKQSQEDMEENKKTISLDAAKDIYEKLKGKTVQCLVNNEDGDLVNGKGVVCGYKDKYLIVGFTTEYEGCIKYFMDNGVFLENRDFLSYRFWNISHINERPITRPFNLELAKAGKPVCTRDGRKARIICWDRYASCYHIVALIECKGFPNKEEEVKVYTDNGKYISGEENAYDLMMSPKSTKDG